MQKKLFLLFALACVMALCACTTSKSVTFSVDTGDNVKVTVNTTDGLDLTMAAPFSVTKEGRELLTGSFFRGEYYDLCREEAEADPDAVILEEGTKDGNDYFFCAVDGAAYSYVVRLSDSKTAVILSSSAGREEAEEAFRETVLALD